MDIIVRANQKVFKFDRIRADARTAGETIRLQKGLAAGRREGLSIGRREGQIQGTKALIETFRDLNVSIVL